MVRSMCNDGTLWSRLKQCIYESGSSGRCAAWGHVVQGGVAICWIDVMWMEGLKWSKEKRSSGCPEKPVQSCYGKLEQNMSLERRFQILGSSNWTNLRLRKWSLCARSIKRILKCNRVLNRTKKIQGTILWDAQKFSETIWGRNYFMWFLGTAGMVVKKMMVKRLWIG